MNLLLKLLYPIFSKYRAWSEKQQRIYEEYQADALARNALAQHKILVNHAFTDLTYGLHQLSLAQKRSLK